MLIALALTLLLFLSVLRYIAEPACPCCSSKRWSSDPGALRCTACGWSNVAAPHTAPGTELTVAPAAPQYEIRFH
jgi:hypothetical protein